MPDDRFTMTEEELQALRYELAETFGVQGHAREARLFELAHDYAQASESGQYLDVLIEEYYAELVTLLS